MRHRPDLTPTARLCILIAEREQRPLGYKEFIHLTGCSLAALHLALPPLVRAGRFLRHEENGMCTFSLPITPAVTQTAGAE